MKFLAVAQQSRYRANFLNHHRCKTQSAPETGAHSRCDPDDLDLFHGIQQLYTLRDLDTFGIEALAIINRFLSSKLFNLYLTQIDSELSIFLPDLPDFTLGRFSSLRCLEDLTKQDLTVLDLLSPHLFQAYANAQYTWQLHQDCRQLQQSLDRLGTIVIADQKSIPERAVTSQTFLELPELSQRENEVLALVLQGRTNKAIAIQLDISISTIRKHLEHIYHKLGVQSRTEAIAQVLNRSRLLDSLLLS